VIEVDDVILHQLRAGDQVAHQARVIGTSICSASSTAVPRRGRGPRYIRNRSAAASTTPRAGRGCGPPVPGPGTWCRNSRRRDYTTSTWASTRRCPSIRVTGSTTIRGISELPTSSRWDAHGISSAAHVPRAAFALHQTAAPAISSVRPLAPRLAAHLRTRRTGDSVQPRAVATPAVIQPPIFPAVISRRNLEPRQAPIERKSRVPEAVGGAGSTAMPGFDGPTGTVVPPNHRALKFLAAPCIPFCKAVPRLAPSSSSVPRTAGIEVGAPLALVVDDVSVGEQRALMASSAGIRPYVSQ